MTSGIENVSDTALWVATYRAQESERPDALFQDRLAAHLAGERGRLIAAKMPYPRILNWFLVIRTVAIDRLVLNAIDLGADTVINLGTGLDTRPYRMALPSTLQWIEIDFPHIIDFKSDALADEKPACRLERLAVDLANIPERRRIFSRIGAESKKVLIITEGVIPYLSSEDAAALSEDLYAVPSFQYWIQDYRQGGLQQWAPQRIKRALKDAPFKFDARDWLAFFMKQGWKIGENILAWNESQRVGRPFPFIFPWSLAFSILPGRIKKKAREASGYVMFTK
jgi:methyltransferase (TIGR00027 family)